MISPYFGVNKDLFDANYETKKKLKDGKASLLLLCEFKIKCTLFLNVFTVPKYPENAARIGIRNKNNIEICTRQKISELMPTQNNSSLSIQMFMIPMIPIS